MLNNWHQHRISKLIVKKLFGTITGKKIAILGFAFKANTNDTRESSAITICKDLLEEGANLFIHDPKVERKQIAMDLGIKENNKIKNYENIKNFGIEGAWSFVEDLMDSFERVDAIIVLTEWEEYSNINWKKVEQVMRKPSWVFDARSIVFKNEIVKSKINLWRIGDGTIS